MRMQSWRRRAAALALLLVVPLTLAPRTSWTLGSVMYDLVASTPRTVVRESTGVGLTLTALSRSDEAEVVTLVMEIAVDGDKSAVDVVSASRGCLVDQSRVACTVTVDPRGSTSLRVIARPLSKGQLVFDVDEGFGGEDFGTVAVDVVPATSSAVGRPRR